VLQCIFYLLGTSGLLSNANYVASLLDTNAVSILCMETCSLAPKLLHAIDDTENGHVLVDTFSGAAIWVWLFLHSRLVTPSSVYAIRAASPLTLGMKGSLRTTDDLSAPVSEHHLMAAAS
jgi:hypothetical protein